jgi:hypothetical protein
MLNGILKSSSVLLSEIVRNNDRKVEIKNGVERLSRQLIGFDSSEIFNRYLKIVKQYLPDKPLFMVDDTDIVKPYAKKMEELGLVKDGSDGYELKNGYLVNEITAIATNGQPISVSSIMYSAKEKEFLSANIIVKKAIANVVRKVSESGTFIFDRGFDDVKLHGFMLKNKQNYIIRSKLNRNVLINGNEYNIADAAKTIKGKYTFGIKFQSGKKDNLKVSYKKVSLRKMPDVPLNMVVVYGFHKDDNEPFILLTNREIDGKDSCLQIVRDYLSRWKIEEYFKFKKQAYEWENVRIRKLKALKNLNAFLTIIIGFIGFIQQQIYSKMIMSLAQPIKEKIAFEYYRLHSGMIKLLNGFRQKIIDFLYPHKEPKQRDFFHYLKYKDRINNLKNFT